MSKLLKAARIVKGATAQELATHLGLSEIGYLELENQISRLSPYYIHLLAVYYGLPIYYFTPEQTLKKRTAQIQQRLEQLKDQPRSRTVPKDKAVIAAELRKSILTEVSLREELLDSLARQLELTERLMATMDIYRKQHRKPMPIG